MILSAIVIIFVLLAGAAIYLGVREDQQKK